MNDVIKGMIETASELSVDFMNSIRDVFDSHYEMLQSIYKSTDSEDDCEARAKFISNCIAVYRSICMAAIHDCRSLNHGYDDSDILLMFIRDILNKDKFKDDGEENENN